MLGIQEPNWPELCGPVLGLQEVPEQLGVSGNLFLNANTASGGANVTHRRRLTRRCSELAALAAELDFVRP